MGWVFRGLPCQHPPWAKQNAQLALAAWARTRLDSFEPSKVTETLQGTPRCGYAGPIECPWNGGLWEMVELGELMDGAFVQRPCYFQPHSGTQAL